MKDPDLMIENLVIGSGPTGYATALSLLDRGKTVHVIDGGLNLFPAELATKRSVTAQKTLFGSGQMYTVSQSAGLQDEISQIPYSEVRGGLSSTWGAGLQVLPPGFFQSWPCKGEGLDAAYKKILSEVDHFYLRDALSERFSWPSAVRDSPPPSSRLGEIANTPRASKNILIGHARLAISKNGSRRCRQCAKCIVGCPYDSIFNSGNELLRIAERNNCLKLLNGFVSRIDPPKNPTGLFEIEIGRTSSELYKLSVGKVYLALGAIATPALLIRSGIVKSEVIVNDSQVFYTSFLSFKRMDEYEQVTLAKLFVVNKNEKCSEFHLSLYSPSQEVTQKIQAKLQEIIKFKLHIPKFISNRIVAGIGFIEPKHSGKIVLNKVGARTSVRKVKNPRTKLTVFQSLRLITFDLSRFGLFRIPFTTQIPEIGSGFHSGGGLRDQTNLQSQYFDNYGRYRKNMNLVVSDASTMVFNIAGPHTLTAMAYAYRNAQKE